jgi:hypothetical protein
MEQQIAANPLLGLFQLSPGLAPARVRFLVDWPLLQFLSTAPRCHGDKIH